MGVLVTGTGSVPSYLWEAKDIRVLKSGSPQSTQGLLGYRYHCQAAVTEAGAQQDNPEGGYHSQDRKVIFLYTSAKTECWTQPKRALGRWAHEPSPYVIKLETKQKVPEKPR